MSIRVAGVALDIDDTRILSDVSLSVESGTVHGIIGPNGSGKSTLLRCIYRALRPAAGTVHFDDDDLWADLSSKAAARRRAVVAQDNSVDLEFSVRELALMGRTPHQGVFDRDTARDHRIVDEALEQVQMGWAAGRLVGTLSGGERQRVFLARALCQQTPILVLDEPTNHLDVRAQVELLRLVRSLGLTTLCALHDLDQAAGFCDRITVMHHGRAVASGPPDEILTVELIREVFGVAAHLGPHPITGRLHIAVAPIDHPVT